ncbi:MAG TPA: plastocyanin/azurin family copper-binding protein [Flavobacteriaceae bacterium]|nr:plastocyanin/azurin family copper-binding protein [Flavobacteriaceae bacterium]
MKRIRIFSLLIIISFFGFSSCKNIESEPKEAVKELSQTNVFESNPEDTLVQITLNTNDKLRYDVGEINVYEGQTIQLTLRHNGTMPATAMGHNFVLKDNDIPLYDFGEKAMRSVHTEYLPEENVMVGTSIIGGGESTTIEFKAPAKGSYDYLCTFTGHYPVMNGTLIVK